MSCPHRRSRMPRKGPCRTSTGAACPSCGSGSQAKGDLCMMIRPGCRLLLFAQVQVQSRLACCTHRSPWLLYRVSALPLGLPWGSMWAGHLPKQALPLLIPGSGAPSGQETGSLSGAAPPDHLLLLSPSAELGPFGKLCSQTHFLPQTCSAPVPVEKPPMLGCIFCQPPLARCSARCVTCLYRISRLFRSCAWCQF